MHHPYDNQGIPGASHVLRGTILDTEDPKKEGRCLVAIHHLHEPIIQGNRQTECQWIPFAQTSQLFGGDGVSPPAYGYPPTTTVLLSTTSNGEYYIEKKLAYNTLPQGDTKSEQHSDPAGKSKALIDPNKQMKATPGNNAAGVITVDA